MNAAPGVSAEAVVVLEAGLLDEGTQSVLAVCEIGGMKSGVGAREETYAALASVGLEVIEFDEVESVNFAAECYTKNCRALLDRVKREN